MPAEVLLDALPRREGVHLEAILVLALGDDHLEAACSRKAVAVLLRHREPAFSVHGELVVAAKHARPRSQVLHFAPP